MRKSLLCVLASAAVVLVAPLAASPAFAASGTTTPTTRATTTTTTTAPSTTTTSTTTTSTTTTTTAPSTTTPSATTPSTTTPSTAPGAKAKKHAGRRAVGTATVAAVRIPATARIFGPKGRVRLRFSVVVQCTKADVGLGVGAAATVTESLPSPAKPVTEKAHELNPIKRHYFCRGGKHRSVRIRFALPSSALLPTTGANVPAGRSATITATGRILPQYREVGARRVAKISAASCSASSTTCAATKTTSGSITITKGTGRVKKH